jgi:ADP-heptose:LPS heptosyltransferase
VRPAFRDPPRFQPQYFSLNGPYALLIPGSSADHPEKRWPLDRFIALARWLADNGVTPVVIGSKAEGDIGMQIGRVEQRSKNLVGRTDLFQLATLAERAAVAIGGDTGPMHLAAAARAPSICLFAQDWNASAELELGTVWNPETRLGRAAPKGGSVTVLFAPTIDRVSTVMVERTCVAMGVMRPGTPLPALELEEPPAPLADAPGSIPRATEDVDEDDLPETAA